MIARPFKLVEIFKILHINLIHHLAKNITSYAVSKHLVDLRHPNVG